MVCKLIDNFSDTQYIAFERYEFSDKGVGDRQWHLNGELTYYYTSALNNSPKELRCHFRVSIRDVNDVEVRQFVSDMKTNQNDDVISLTAKIVQTRGDDIYIDDDWNVVQQKFQTIWRRAYRPIQRKRLEPNWIYGVNEYQKYLLDDLRVQF